MHSIFAVLLVLACASAQNFSDVKHMKIEVDLVNDPLVKQEPVEKNPSPENDEDSKIRPTGRIINGAQVFQGFQWQALIYMDNSYMCGGSIISPQWIMTAAHCAKGFTNIVITLGTRNRAVNQPGQLKRLAKKIIWNTNYSDINYNNDIAVLNVDTISYSPTISSVQLPKTSDAYKTFTGQLAFISGFGITASGSISNTLQFAPVTVISNTDCQRVFGTSYVASTNICTKGVNNMGTCNGDSGGPLVYLEGARFTEIGIVSFGVKGCIGAPSAYTRVSRYLDWISKNTGIPLRS